MRILHTRLLSLAVALIVFASIAVTGTAWAAFHLKYAENARRSSGLVSLPDLDWSTVKTHQARTVLPVAAVSAPPTRRMVAPAPSSSSGSIWDRIASCESGGNWSSTGGSYEGGVQFLHSTWVAAGGRRYAEHAYQATREQQIAIASSWLAKTSWSQWPACSRRVGVR